MNLGVMKMDQTALKLQPDKPLNQDPAIFLNENTISLPRYKLRKLLRKCRNDIRLFITHFLKVKPKKGGKPIPFKLKPPQEDALQQLIEKYLKPFAKDREGKTIYRLQQVRMLVVKYRQVGFSTLILALMLHDCLFFEGTEAAIFLHNDKYSRGMLERLKDMLQTLPKYMRPRMTKGDRDSQSRLAFKKINSNIEIGTPGKSSEIAGDKGRSKTYQDVLISELPRYPYPEEFMQGIMASAKFGNVYIESTPLTLGDYYHGLYIDGKNGVNDWLVLFYPWVIEEEYSKPLTPEQEQAILASLHKDEMKLMENYPELVTAGKIAFRRETIATDFKGNVARFKQEYPEDDKSCFLGSGFNIFQDPQVELLQVLAPDALNIEADPDDFYMIGVDVARGLGGRHDSSCIQVISFKTGKQVYRWSDNTLSDKLLPWEIFKVWKMYPGIIAVEANDVGEGVLATLRNNQAFSDNELLQGLIFATSRSQDGWRTGSNKSVMISDLYQALKDSALGRLGGVLLSDQGTVDELEVFQDLGGGKMGAPEGTSLHDDRVIALAIAWQMRNYALSYFDFLREWRIEHVQKA